MKFYEAAGQVKSHGSLTEWDIVNWTHNWTHSHRFLLLYHTINGWVTHVVLLQISHGVGTIHDKAVTYYTIYIARYHEGVETIIQYVTVKVMDRKIILCNRIVTYQCETKQYSVHRVRQYQV